MSCTTSFRKKSPIAKFEPVTDILSAIRRIPFDNTKEATKAIQPVLGDAYHRDNTNFVYALWRDFSSCQWVVPDNAERSEDQALWFVGPKGQLTARVSLT